MEILKLDYIKQHSRIDFDCEDAVLELYGTAAEETLAGYLNRGEKAVDMVESLTEQYGGVPAPIIQAALMLVDASYQQRSPVSVTQVHAAMYGFDTLVKPYMIL